MKKLFFVLLLAVSSLSCSFAQEKPDSAKPQISPQVNALKIRPFSPIFSSAEIAYERGGLFGGNKSLEVSAAYLLPTLFSQLFNNGLQAVGAKVGIGAKWYFGKQILKGRDEISYKHPLYGKYLKIVFNGSTKTGRVLPKAEANYTLTQKNIQGLLIIGNQFVIRGVCLDVFAGVGLNTSQYSSTSTSIYNNTKAYNDKKYVGLGAFAADAGIRMGFLFKTKK